MDVICIDNKMRKYSFSDPSMYIKEGAIYTITGKDTATCWITGTVIKGYTLAGIDKRNVFAEDRFIPLDSDLDETELVTEEFEEKYCVPVK